MKIVIDIDEDIYKHLIQTGENTIILSELLDLRNSIRNGTPLEEVKAEIEKIRLNRARFRTSDGTVVYIDSQNILEVLNNILDRIGKESEDT